MSTKKCAIPPTAQGRGFPCEGLDEIERLEQIAMSMVVQALKDYQKQAATIFKEHKHHWIGKLLENIYFAGKIC